jgi:hypothetical protein
LQKTIDRSEHTRAGERQNEPGAPLFKRIEQEHAGDCKQSKKGESIQRDYLQDATVSMIINYFCGKGAAYEVAAK